VLGQVADPMRKKRNLRLWRACVLHVPGKTVLLENVFLDFSS
jgi:hypothetical protein